MDEVEEEEGREGCKIARRAQSSKKEGDYRTYTKRSD